MNGAVLMSALALATSQGGAATSPATPTIRGPAATTNSSAVYGFRAASRSSRRASPRFRCRLDRLPLRPCAARLRLALTVGRHVLRVGAVGARGRVSAVAELAVVRDVPPAPPLQVRQQWSVDLGRRPLGQQLVVFPVAVSAQGVYVGDPTNSRVDRITADGRPAGAWGAPGTGPGQFDGIFADDVLMGITVDASAHVLVADSGNRRVQEFTADGAFSRSWGRAGTGPGEFTRPESIGVDATGHVLVLDDRNARVQEFDEGGGFLRSFGKSELVDPGGLAVDTTGAAYVTDFGQAGVFRYSPSGRFVGVWPGLPRPVGVAVGPDGNVYIALGGGVEELRPNGLPVGLAAVRQSASPWARTVPSTPSPSSEC